MGVSDICIPTVVAIRVISIIIICNRLLHKYENVTEISRKKNGKKAFQHVLLTWLWSPFLLAAASSCMLSHQSNKEYLVPRELQCPVLLWLHFWILSSTLGDTSKCRKPSWIWYTGLFLSQANEYSVVFYIKEMNKRTPNNTSVSSSSSQYKLSSFFFFFCFHVFDILLYLFSSFICTNIFVPKKLILFISFKRFFYHLTSFTCEYLKEMELSFFQSVILLSQEYKI